MSTVPATPDAAPEDRREPTAPAHAGEAPSAVDDLATALALFAINPGTGLSLHAAAGPVRQIVLVHLRAMLPPQTPWRRVPAAVAPDALLGGIDLSASLREGRRIAQSGLIAQAAGGVLIAAMAERLDPMTAALLAAALDGHAGQQAGASSSDPTGLIALDESEPDEALPAALADRLAFSLDLTPFSHRDLPPSAFAGPATIAAARLRLTSVVTPDELPAAFCEACAALGIESARVPLAALAAARAHAAFAGRPSIAAEDAECAVRLVLAPRATRLPAEPPSPDENHAQEPPAAPPADQAPLSQDRPDEMAEMLIAAARAAIPKNLLAQLAAAAALRGTSPSAGKAGARKRGKARGRPVGVRAALPGPGLRLALAETLRAAAPWQRLRSSAPKPAPVALKLRRDDFRVFRTEHPMHSTTIFVVDASGSSALNRLGEAKGAVELLLADCYARRDQVAVIAFRGQRASLLLPPTRSLTRAKRSLSGLPGGGATPLASGLAAARMLADATSRAGNTPTLVVLTDGKANIPLSGPANRAQAEQDALSTARALRAHRAIVIDIAPRPSHQAQALAAAMAARYLPLPYASAAAVSEAVRGAT